jgi:hypothetical protein
MYIVALAAVLSALTISAQSVDEIVAKSLAARGGVDKIKTIQTQRLTGHISLGPDAEGPFMVEIKRGNKMREEMTLGGKVIIRTMSGSAGWIVAGDDEPQALPAGAVRNMSGGADIDGPLMDYKAKGNKVELQGKEKVEGRDAYKLMVSMASGQVRYEFIDCETYLGTKWQGKIAGGDKDFDVESYFHDYKKVDGVMFAFAIDSNTVGDPNKQKLVFDEVEVNIPLDDARFGKPTPAAAGTTK